MSIATEARNVYMRRVTSKCRPRWRVTVKTALGDCHVAPLPLSSINCKTMKWWASRWAPSFLVGLFIIVTCIVQDTIPISSMISREFAVPNQRATNVNRVLLIVSYDGIPRDFVILIALLSPIRR